MRLLLSLVLCLLVLCVTGAPSAPATPPDLLAGGAWSWVTPSPTEATEETASPPDAPVPGPVLRLTITKPSDPYYLIMLSQVIAPALPEGMQVRFHFWGRSATGNPVRAVVEQAVSPYARALDQRVILTPRWKEYAFTATVPAYGPNGLGARFQVGQQAGVIELTGIRLERLGLDPHIVAARAAIAPAAIQARIRRYRMADLTVVVHDARGRPVPQASVQVRQTRHAFLFGCNIFGLQPDNTDPAQKAYQQRFAALFNYATLPFYWGAFESTPGQPDYARLETMARWCRAHGITPKGHPLIWHEVYPAWAPKDPDAAIPLLHARVTDLVTHYRGLISYWDVVNEATAAADHADTGEGAWVKREGPARVVATALGWARAAGHGTPETFLYNDFNTSEANVALLSQLASQHALPDAIGLQSHMHGGNWPMAQVWATCERFSQFGRPIHFTETTVLSGPRRSIDYNGPYPTDWLTTPEGEKVQADYVIQFYTLLFSHPSLRAITWWDFSDTGAWLGAPAGFLRRDMTPKPVYDRLLTLIHKTWWTNAHGRTDAAGHYKVHAFYGDYTLTATDSHGHTASRAFSCPEAGATRTAVVTLP